MGGDGSPNRKQVPHQKRRLRRKIVVEGLRGSCTGEWPGTCHARIHCEIENLERKCQLGKRWYAIPGGMTELDAPRAVLVDVD